MYEIRIEDALAGVILGSFLVIIITIITPNNSIVEEKITKYFGTILVFFMITGGFFLGLEKVYPENKTIVNHLNFTKIVDKKLGKYMLEYKVYDYLIPGFKKKFLLKYRNPKIIKNSAKGNLYEEKCSFSEHWTGWWGYNYYQCEETLHIAPKK